MLDRLGALAAEGPAVVVTTTQPLRLPRWATGVTLLPPAEPPALVAATPIGESPKPAAVEAQPERASSEPAPPAAPADAATMEDNPDDLDPAAGHLRTASVQGRAAEASPSGFLAIVPLMYGALYLWSNWDPYGRLDQVPVAVVNEDVPVQFEGETVNAGWAVRRAARAGADLRLAFHRRRRRRRRSRERPLLPDRSRCRPTSPRTWSAAPAPIRAGRSSCCTATTSTAT